jgi:hypothetical protein
MIDFCTETLDNESKVHDFSNLHVKEEMVVAAYIEEVSVVDIETKAWKV